MMATITQVRKMSDRKSANVNDTPLDPLDVSRPELIDRPSSRAHVAFGFGVHRCMGNRLAEMQLRVLWEEIMQRFSNTKLAGDVVCLPNNFIRGISEVPVILQRK